MHFIATVTPQVFELGQTVVTHLKNSEGNHCDITTEDPAKKLWIGNIPEEANWKDLQALVDKAQ